MSEAKHTPTPWQVRKAVRPDNTGGYDYAIIAPGVAIIAECYEHTGYAADGVTYLKRPAFYNATVMALAPDLLDQLALMVEHYVKLAGCGDCGHWNPEKEEEIIAARALIAKARVTE